MRLLIFILLFSLGADAQIIRANPFYRSINTSAPYCSDSDAEAFIVATGITDGTQKDAICNLVQDLKDSSLWSSLLAIYPFVGGTATTHKFNLKNPANTDAAYRLTFSGTWTHSSNGADPNGINAYANTHYAPSANATATSRHISFYSMEDVQTGRDIGSSDGSYNGDLFHIEYSDNKTYGQIGSTDGSATAGNSAAFYIASRIDNVDSRIYKNGAHLFTKTSANIFNSTYNIYIGNINYAGALGGLYSNRQVSFVSLGAGLTAAQAATLNRIVEEYQDALSRGVQ